VRKLDPVAPLSNRARAALPKSAFAWVDSTGRRRLPIHDEAHVRNALARFSRTPFETPEAREQARNRLLRAAKKFGIMPVGFIDGQLKRARDGDVSDLPKGEVTFLRTDIENSTGLLQRLDGRYGPLLDDVRGIIRRAVRRHHGVVIDSRADEFFAAFSSAPDALDAAVEIQRALAEASWPEGVKVRVRIGLHTGRPTLRKTGYVGMDVHAVARICAAGHGGQILLSAAAYRALTAALPPGVKLKSLGTHRLRGLPEPIKLFQVEADGLPTSFPPLRLDADPEARAAEAEARGWDEVWARSAVGHAGGTGSRT
jgi:class 3 adenylate cyclase